MFCVKLWYLKRSEADESAVTSCSAVEFVLLPFDSRTLTAQKVGARVLRTFFKVVLDVNGGEICFERQQLLPVVEKNVNQLALWLKVNRKRHIWREG